MIRGLASFVAVLIGIAAIGVYLSAFIVSQTEQAIVLRFGQPIEYNPDAESVDERTTISKPGLYWRIPIVDEVAYFDKRILDLGHGTAGADHQRPETSGGRCLRAVPDHQPSALLSDRADRRTCSKPSWHLPRSRFAPGSRWIDLPGFGARSA
jgi:hypothetical protein